MENTVACSEENHRQIRTCHMRTKVTPFTNGIQSASYSSTAGALHPQYRLAGPSDPTGLGSSISVSPTSAPSPAPLVMAANIMPAIQPQAAPAGREEASASTLSYGTPLQAGNLFPQQQYHHYSSALESGQQYFRTPYSDQPLGYASYMYHQTMPQNPIPRSVQYVMYPTNRPNPHHQEDDSSEHMFDEFDPETHRS